MPSKLNAMRVSYGLDQPMHIQYIRWLGKLLHGDMGLSLLYMLPNKQLIGERLGPTILLALFSFILSWLIAIPSGIYSATHKNSFGDYFFMVINYIESPFPTSSGTFINVVFLFSLRFESRRLVFSGV